jgi:hypothetical protein
MERRREEAAPSDPVAADPARYAVLYENDVAVMIRAKAHESPNNAKSVNQAIAIEFKNRDRFKP